MTDLRREPAQFFIFLLFLVLIVFTMSNIFRSLAAATKTLAQAMAMAGVMVLAIVIYSGFVIHIPSMHPWFSWIRWCNPLFYSFEALIANQFHGQNFECSGYVPSYNNLVGDQFVCSVTGAVAGQRFVSGDAYIETSYQYYYSHIWRNLGIVIAYLVFSLCTYLVASELNSGSSSVAEFLVFRRGHEPKYMQDLQKNKISGEPGAEPEESVILESEEKIDVLPEQHDVFTWSQLTYDIPVKEGTRRLLDGVSGWVKPGTLTALMVCHTSQSRHS